MASQRQESGRPTSLADRGTESARQRAVALAVAATAVLGSIALLPTSALGSSGGVSVGEDGGTGATSELRVRKSSVKPRKVYFAGKRQAKLTFALKGSDPADIEIRLYHVASDTSVRTWRLTGVKPGKSQSLTWKGKQASGELGRNGEHEFRIFDADGLAAVTKGAKGDPRFGFYRHEFPLRGSHTYGDGLGAGRGHRGQDLFASCGRRIVAARGGRVQWRRYQGSAAGYYVVIDGKGTDQDYVYMHLKRKGRPPAGKTVKTGQRIGFNGRSGNAQGCHLHFEMWDGPGWFEGGRWMDAAKHLRRWDGWS